MRAVAAANAFFKAEGVTPEQAARAARELEGALEPDQDYEVSEESCRRAEVWSGAPEAVAKPSACPAMKWTSFLLTRSF